MANPLIKFVKSVCVQTAVYWENPQPDGYGGMDYDDPIEISCRWDGSTQRITNNEGEEIVSRAEVLVTQDLDDNGMLYLGTLDDLDSSQQNDPASVPGAHRIQKIDKNPLFRSASEFVRVAYL